LRVCRPVVADHLVEKQDPDPNRNGEQDPDPHQNGKPDPHQSEKKDLDLQRCLGSVNNSPFSGKKEMCAILRIIEY
jgi:hypothetical protein